MAFEDFLRSIPLVHKHIMRTRMMMHENKQFRKFLKRNGISPQAVIENENEVDGEDLALTNATIPTTDIEVAFKTVSTSLRTEQTRASHLEASLYLLQIDYNNLLLQSHEDSSEKIIPVSNNKASKHKVIRKKGKK